MSVKKLDFNSVRQSKKSFTTNFNEVIQNIPDGFILGIYIYLSSLPADWNVNVQHLMNHFNVGRDKIKRTIKWLSDNKLIKYIRIRNQDGTFNNCSIEVSEGLDFLDKNYVNQIDESTSLKTNPVVKTSRSTVLKIQRLDNPSPGKSVPTNTIINTNTTKRERPTENQNPLSVFFEPDKENESLCKQLGLSMADEVRSFVNRHRGKKTQYEFERWIKSSFDYQSKKISKISINHSEPRQTVQFWGKGHPSYDAIHGL